MDSWRTRRGGILLIIAVLHLAIIGWLASQPPVGTILRPAETLLSLGSFPKEKRPSRSPSHMPAVARPSAKTPADPILVNAVSVPMGASASSSASDVASLAGDQCNLITATQAAIEQDPAAMAELASLPPNARTQADAVMLWNGGWLELGSPPVPAGSVAPSSELRAAILLAIGSTNAACRETPVAGPLFIAIPETGRTTTLVIGSGVWRWSDLLEPAPTCGEIGSKICPVATIGP